MKPLVWFYPYPLADGYVATCEFCEKPAQVQFVPARLDLCQEHYQERRESLLASVSCAYCAEAQNLFQCDMCSLPCCYGHSYETPLSVFTGKPLDAASLVLECVECSCK